MLLIRRVPGVCALGLLCSTLPAQVPDPAPKPPVPQVDSVVMARIFTQDQEPRQEHLSLSEAKAKWGDVNVSDAARREQVRALLATGELHTGKDFWEAAFIFQHSREADDYLLAHTLASIAVAKGNPNGLWIMASSLDRYLQSIHQPQIYGTQSRRDNASEAFTQEPYNRILVSDALRKELQVPSQAEQQSNLKSLNKAEAH